MLDSMDDVAEVLAKSLQQGGLILHESELAPEFFDLRTRIAGELFQKIMNYHSRLAIVVQEPNQHGERFSELIHEHKSHSTIRFFASVEPAVDWLKSQR